MGVVYAAEDPRLGRTVALKTVRTELASAEARERLRREARAAASINHPNICQLYEIGEDAGELFLAMELLEGEPLAARIERGAMPVREAVQIALDILGGLGAVHRRGILHRDLKPSNVFLTAHGAKLLDFGVARAAVEDAQNTLLALTGAGSIIGTPRYMAPEYASGEPIDARSDLFAVGAILYEMLAGQPAFHGDTAVRVLHAVQHAQPPVLGGSAAIAAVDRVVHRALSKQPSARHASAEAFARELRAACSDSSAVEAVQARPLSRLIVLPFRLLRPDPDVDFLAFSLADAVTASVSGLGSLVVRSSLTAAKFGADADLQKIAREADVDVVLSGTLLRAGDRMRLTAELAEAPGGAVLWSHVMQVSSGDIFQLHDTLVQKLIEALSIPLTAREHRMLGRDVPASAKAYECYLRANELAKDAAGWDAAVELYKQCLEQDPRYAPAWARLGSVYRVMAKFRVEDGTATRALSVEVTDRALAINPDLSIAHKVLAHIDVESGRAQEAMTRLLWQARQVAADPELFAALCHACRYCGLLDASLAAHEQAVRLDAKANTSVIHTWYLLKNYQRVVDSGTHGGPFIVGIALFELGRASEALALLLDIEPRVPPRMRDFIAITRAVIEGRAEDLPLLGEIVDHFSDPEGLYYAARSAARLGGLEIAMRGLARAIDGGYACYPVFAADSWLEPLRGHEPFENAMQRAKERHEAALAAFDAADGDRIVGVRLAPHD